MNPKQIAINNHYYIYDADIFRDFDPQIFNPKALKDQGILVNRVQGRGECYVFLKYDNDYILRHYQRGGLFSKLVYDRYLWTGLSSTRAWCEWHLLRKLRKLALPVPNPVAAHITKNKFMYYADLITQHLPNTQTLAAYLKERKLSASGWQNIGSIIQKFHAAGVYHADLNAHNILLNTEHQIFLIDFDKGKFIAPKLRWQQKNLSRLHRSLLKLNALFPTFNYSEVDWTELHQAYSQQMY